MLTLQDLMKLRTQKPREFDTLVCEKLFGWTDFKSPEVVTSAIDGLTGFAPNPNGGDKKCWRCVPEFTRSAGDDLSCHRHALKWGIGLTDNYFRFLEDVLSLNDGSVPDGELSLWCMCAYQVGDYATAALCTQLRHEEWKIKQAKKEEAEKQKEQRIEDILERIKDLEREVFVFLPEGNL